MEISRNQYSEELSVGQTLPKCPASMSSPSPTLVLCSCSTACADAHVCEIVADFNSLHPKCTFQEFSSVSLCQSLCFICHSTVNCGVLKFNLNFELFRSRNEKATPAFAMFSRFFNSTYATRWPVESTTKRTAPTPPNSANTRRTWRRDCCTATSKRLLLWAWRTNTDKDTQEHKFIHIQYIHIYIWYTAKACNIRHCLQGDNCVGRWY